MNNNPIFVGTPRLTTVESAATALRDGSSGTLYSLFVANTTTGSRIERITCMSSATVSSSANAVRIYATQPGGTSPKLIREGLLAATSPTATVLGAYVTFNFQGGLMLGTASSIYVGQSTYTSASDKLHWSSEGGDFN